MNKPLESMSVDELKAEVERLEFHDYCRSMSDSFWYSNGGHAEVKSEIQKVERERERRA